MILKDLKIGFAFTGSYCVFDKVFPQLESLVAEGAEVVPVVSYQVASTDSRYGMADDFLASMQKITGRLPIQDMFGAEIINKNEKPLDLLVIAPATGNTLSKLAYGASDTPVLMLAKEMFRNNKAVVLGIATNDGLGISAKTIGTLLSTKNIYFIPFGQDNYKEKPNSLVAKFDRMLPTLLAALEKEQLQPLLEIF